MRQCAAAAARRVTVSGQSRRPAAAAAAAYPPDPPTDIVDVEVAGNKGTASLTSRQRANWKLGPTNEASYLSGHRYNVYDRDDEAFPCPVTGWKPDRVKSTLGQRPSADDNELTAYTPGNYLPHGYTGASLDSTALSSVQKCVVSLKLNPPLNHFDLFKTQGYRLGSGHHGMGGSVDPKLGHELYENLGIGGLTGHMFLVNEPADGIVDTSMDDSVVKDGVMHTKFTDTKHRLQRLQIPFSKAREEQGFKDMPLIAGGDRIHPHHPGRIELEIKRHFRDCGVGYVVDGAASSCADDEVRVRIVTDSSSHALFWTNLLQTIPGKDYKTMGGFRPPVLLWHAPGYHFENERVIEEFAGPKPWKDMGLAHEKFLLVDPYSKPATGIIGGDLTIDTARDVLAYLCGIVQFEELDVLTLPADAVLSNDGKSATIYFGAGDAIRSNPFLFASHHVQLSPDGVSRMWDSVSKPADDKSLAAGDLVTEQDGKRTQHTPLLRRIGDPTSRPKPRSQHFDVVQRRIISKRYASVDPTEGIKFGSAKKTSAVMLPNSIPTHNVTAVFCEQGAKQAPLTAEKAAEKFVSAIQNWGWPYASDEELTSSFQQAVERGLKCSVGPVPK